MECRFGLMQCQREPASPRRVRLTDQGLVAVAVARESAAAHDRTPTAIDVLVGLGAEPDGWAGQLLRARGAALVSLAGRAASPPPGLAVLSDIVAAAADRAAPRPPGTHDLLAAVLTVGGADVDDLLERCGYATGDLWPDEGRDGGSRGGDEQARDRRAAVQETVTLVGPGLPALTVEAARAVGRVRAGAGGAVDLLLLLLLDDEGHERLGDAAVLSALAARRHLERTVPPRAARTPWDAGLAVVLDTVGDLASGREATPGDLLHAVLLAGGSGPLAVLLRHAEPDPD
jgi:hypothetical protein